MISRSETSHFPHPEPASFFAAAHPPDFGQGRAPDQGYCYQVVATGITSAGGNEVTPGRK